MQSSARGCAILFAACVAGCSNAGSIDHPTNDGGPGSDVACGSNATILASAQGGPLAVAVDATNVYWATADAIMKVPLGGGTPVTIVSSQSTVAGGIGSIAVDSTSVYYTIQDLDTGSVMKVALAGGNPVTLATGQNGPLGIAVDSANVYWTNYGLGNQSQATENTVMSAPLDGGSPLTLASGGNPYGLAVDETGAFYTVPGGYVMAAPLDGGIATTLTPLGGTPAFIAVDATNIYWVDVKVGAVEKMPKGGGAMVTLATYPTRTLSAGENPTQLAVDSSNVYWVVPGDGGSCGNGTVMKVPLGGGASTAVASDQGSPQGIALGPTDVYWANYVGGEVSVSPK